MSTEREMIDRPKYDDGSTEVNASLRREDLPCPAGTRIWISLSEEEKYYTRWSPENRHWWLELPTGERAFRTPVGETQGSDPADDQESDAPSSTE